MIAVMARHWRRIAVLAGIVAIAVYGAASYVVYDKLSATRALCRGDAAALDNTPADFELGPPDEAVDVAGYAMNRRSCLI